MSKRVLFERYGTTMACDESRLYTTNRNGIQIWALGSLEPIAQIAFPRKQLRLCIDHDYIYCTSFYHLTVFDQQSLKPVHEAQYGTDASSDLGRPLIDAERLYFPIRNGRLVVIPKGDLSRPTILEPQSESIWAMALDDDRFYTAGVDKVIRIWDKQKLTVTQELLGHTQNVQSLTVAGPHLFSGSTDRSVIIWEKETGRLVRQIRQAHARAVSKLLCREDRLLSYSVGEGMVRTWAVASGKLVRERRLPISGEGIVLAGDRVYMVLLDADRPTGMGADELFG